jgi:hypothetical protein
MPTGYARLLHSFQYDLRYIDVLPYKVSHYQSIYPYPC